MAVAAARFAKESHISARRGRWILPRSFLGISLTDWMFPWMPMWVQRIMIRAIIRMCFGDYTQYGLPIPDHAIFETHPTINSDLLQQIQLQRIIPHSAITNFLGGKQIQFADGSIVEVSGGRARNAAPFRPQVVLFGRMSRVLKHLW